MAKMWNALLIYNPGSSSEESYPFEGQIVIGRRADVSDDQAAVTIRDPLVSSRHCVITQSSNGHFFIRDVSRNGTRLAGRRLVPNVEFEINPGDSLSIGDHSFILKLADQDGTGQVDEDYDEQTRIVTGQIDVTILVGDIRDYTVLNQKFSTTDIYPSIHRIFAELERIVQQYEGTIKEYQGDAIFAFWESNPDKPGWHTKQACKAALALHEKLKQMASDSSVWGVQEFPLHMEWALTSGPVLFSNMGGERPTGLAMIGDVVNYAFGLEKLANEDTGLVLACDRTHTIAGTDFRFREIGNIRVKGRENAQMVYALEGSDGRPD